MEAHEFKNWRLRHDLTQESVAQKFRVSRTTVQNWESGATPITPLVDMGVEIWEPRLNQENPDFGPVTLIYTDGPMFVDPYGPRRPLAMMQQEPYPSNAAALGRVQKLWGQDRFHNPFILDKATQPLWNYPQLARVVAGEDPGAPTVQNLIKRVAQEMKAAAAGSTVWGANRPTELQKIERKQQIEGLADQLEAIGAGNFQEVALHQADVERIIYSFQNYGTRAPDRLVTNIAQAFVAAERP